VREEGLTLYRTRHPWSPAGGSTNKIIAACGQVDSTVAVCVSYLSVYLCTATNIK
jgi:hypothetical protein